MIPPRFHMPVKQTSFAPRFGETNWARTPLNMIKRTLIDKDATFGEIATRGMAQEVQGLNHALVQAIEYPNVYGEDLREKADEVRQAAHMIKHFLDNTTCGSTFIYTSSLKHFGFLQFEADL